MRKIDLERNTKETQITLSLNLDGSGKSKKERKTNRWGQGINYGFYITTKENDKLHYLNTTFLDDLVELFKTKYKIADSYYKSSSMDFATESGFYHNEAAKRVWDLAYDIANSDAKDIKEYTKGVLDNSVRIHDIKWTDLVGEDEHKK